MPNFSVCLNSICKGVLTREKMAISSNYVWDEIGKHKKTGEQSITLEFL